MVAWGTAVPLQLDTDLQCSEYIAKVAVHRVAKRKPAFLRQRHRTFNVLVLGHPSIQRAHPCARDAGGGAATALRASALAARAADATVGVTRDAVCVQGYGQDIRACRHRGAAGWVAGNHFEVRCATERQQCVVRAPCRVPSAQYRAHTKEGFGLCGSNEGKEQKSAA